MQSGQSECQHRVVQCKREWGPFLGMIVALRGLLAIGCQYGVGGI